MNVTTANGKFLQICFVKNAEYFHVIAFPSKKYYINYVLCCVVNVFLTLSTIFFNATTVLAYWKSSQLKKKKPYFLVMLLSMNDIAVGVFANSAFTVFLVRELLGYENCLLAILFRILTTKLSGMSILTIFILNVERYLSTFRPIFHRNKVTKRRLLIATVVLWGFGAMESYVQLINDKVGRIGLSSSLAVLLSYYGIHLCQILSHCQESNFER